MSSQECADIGLIGLAVMGQNLVLNMNDKGFIVCVYNRTVEKVDAFLANEAKGTRVLGARSIQDFCAKLKRPRKIVLLVKAGAAVDDFIEQLAPHLENGDVIVDGGNSFYNDTARRVLSCKQRNLCFVGAGVSGGEEGARHGPSIMPGGDPDAWPVLKPIFQAIAASATTADGQTLPCCDWVGAGASGHFVKMVHNGIEYGDMQLICEAYHIMRDLYRLSADDMAKVFEEWNKGDLDSFLVEITANILAFKDTDNAPLVDKIRDAAGQKGTGKWTVCAALDAAAPVTMIAEAVFARCLSSKKGERERAHKLLPGPNLTTSSTTSSSSSSQAVGDVSLAVVQKKDRAALSAELNDLMLAVYAAKVISYAQGFMLLKDASAENKWNLDYGAIANMWRGGCIIRSRFLGEIKRAFDEDASLENLLFSAFFINVLKKGECAWRRVIARAVTAGVPVPAMSSALAFYDGYRCPSLPANLLQAQRDYFGAHTFERLSSPGKFEHVNWTGRGGSVASSTYNA